MLVYIVCTVYDSLARIHLLLIILLAELSAP